jgi:hypothetical protein
MSFAAQRDDAVLRYVGYNSRARRDTAVILGHGRASLSRLLKAGLVKTDETYSGCLVLTEADAQRLDLIDSSGTLSAEAARCAACGEEAAGECVQCDRPLCDEHRRTTSVPGDSFCRIGEGCAA